MSRGDELIEALRTRDLTTAATDQAAVDLLGELGAGYPTEKLESLFMQPQSASAARAGAWIASELGADAAPLLEQIASLLMNEARYVRFFAIDAVLAGAGREHGPVIASAIGLILDWDDAVRWKALQLLTRGSQLQLETAIPHLRDEHLRALTAWLAAAPEPGDIIDRLSDVDRPVRLFATAAAVRVAARDRGPLDRAAGSQDDEISSFAREQIGLMSLRRGRP